MNRSESDLCSYEATVAKKASTGLETMTLCDIMAMLCQWNYKASLAAGQERVQFIWPLYEESEIMCI